MLEVMAGPDPRDPLTTARPQPDYLAAVRGAGDLTRAAHRLARRGWATARSRPRCWRRAKRRWTTFAHAGRRRSIELTAAVRAIRKRSWFVNNGAYRMAQFGHHLRQHRAIMCPTFVRQMDRVAAITRRRNCTRRSSHAPRCIARCRRGSSTADIVAMPTLSRSAVPIDQDFFGPIEIDNQPVENIRASWYPYTMPFNLTGNPAISLPCGFDRGRHAAGDPARRIDGVRRAPTPSCRGVRTGAALGRSQTHLGIAQCLLKNA